MDLRKIKTLIGLFEESSLSELELSAEGEQIRIVRGGTAAPAAVSASPMPGAEVTPALEQPAGAVNEPAADEPADMSNAVTSPLVGSFYRKPSPDEPPFVEVGQEVQEGAVLCIIEAMKIMNPVKAERAGVVSKILVSDGSPVEYGQPLMIID